MQRSRHVRRFIQSSRCAYQHRFMQSRQCGRLLHMFMQSRQCARQVQRFMQSRQCARHVLTRIRPDAEQTILTDDSTYCSLCKPCSLHKLLYSLLLISNIQRTASVCADRGREVAWVCRGKGGGGGQNIRQRHICT